jgi:hypothetical protein
MSRLRSRVGLGVLFGWAWFFLASLGLGQTTAPAVSDGLQPTISNWQQRVLRSGGVRPASYQAAQPAVVADPGASAVGGVVVPQEGVVVEQSGAIVDPAVYGPPAPDAYLEDAPGCGDCGTCGPACGGCDLFRSEGFCWLRGLSLFGGVQGFKGPLDQGRNGNFGFHEGLNFGAPVTDDCFGLGYQVGFLATQSNLTGDQTTLVNGQPYYENDGRNQVFFTTGLFHRAEEDWGLQGALVFDYLHDNYYARADLEQLRAELSLRLDCMREVGYWGAYHLNTDHFSDGVLFDFEVQATDLHAFFYRRHFTGGGQGRIWGGFTGYGDALIGGDATIPLGRSWALETEFNYLFPRHDGVTGQAEENWNAAIRLVWYPGRCAHEAINAPFQPVLGVADNSVFMVKPR